MYQFLTKGRLKFNKILGYISLFLSFVGVVAFFAFNQPFLEEVRVLMDTFNLKSPDKILSHFLLPFKTFFDISQFFSVVVFFINCIIAIFAVGLFIFICIKIFMFTIVNDDEKNKIVPAYSATNQAVYIINSRFNC